MRKVFLETGEYFTDEDFDILLLDYGVQLQWEDDKGFYETTYPWHKIRVINDVEEK